MSPPWQVQRSVRRKAIGDQVADCLGRIEALAGQPTTAGSLALIDSVADATPIWSPGCGRPEPCSSPRRT